MSGPLTRVLAAFEAGAGSLVEVEVRTGLPRDSVRAAVDHLVRLGRLDAQSVSLGCSSSGTGCGSCPSGGGDGRSYGGSACASAHSGAGSRRAPLVSLTLRRTR